MRAKGTGKVAPPEVKTPEMEAQAVESEIVDLDSKEADEALDADQEALLAELEEELENADEAPIIEASKKRPLKTPITNQPKAKAEKVKKAEKVVTEVTEDDGDHEDEIEALEARLNELKAIKEGSGLEAKKIRRTLRKWGVYVPRLAA